MSPDNEKIDALIRDKFFEILAEARSAYSSKLYVDGLTESTINVYERALDQFICYMKRGYRPDWRRYIQPCPIASS